MKVALVVLADNESHEGLGWVVNAMVAAKKFEEAGDEVRWIVDDGGTVWPGELSRDDHRAHQLRESVHASVHGACSCCADAFGATKGVEEAGVRLLDEYKRHPSFQALLADGYTRHHLLTALNRLLGGSSITARAVQRCVVAVVTSHRRYETG